MDKEKFDRMEKELLQVMAFTERYFGMKTLTAWQCIYCAHIMDNMKTASTHPSTCQKRKDMKKANE